MNKKLHLALILALCVIIGAGGAWIAYMQWYVVGQETVGIRFEVVEGMHIGFDLNDTVLTFGKVSQGGSAQRKATVESYVPATAHISISGTSWISVSNSTLALEPEVPEQVIFILQVPENATPGNYSGKARIKYIRR